MQRGKYSPEKIEKKERDDTFISVPLLVKMLQTARQELKRQLHKAIIVYRKTAMGITAVSNAVFCCLAAECVGVNKNDFG